MNKRGLGRGLGALIPDLSDTPSDSAESIRTIPVSSIEPNPHQPRKDFPEEEIVALAESIREQGLLQPVVVRPGNAGAFELIAGERRWRAVMRAGFDQVPAVVRETTDDDLLPLALVENLVREDLNPIEEAMAYQQLSGQPGWTQEAIARRVGKGRAHVANTLRLLKLPREIREDLAAGTLTRGHARALLVCESEAEMLDLREQIHSQSLSVREAEDRVTKDTPRPRRKSKGTKSPRLVSPETRELEERLQRIYGTPVQIHERRGRGRVALEFYSIDDLTRLVDLLLTARMD